MGRGCHRPGQFVREGLATHRSVTNALGLPVGDAGGATLFGLSCVRAGGRLGWSSSSGSATVGAAAGNSPTSSPRRPPSEGVTCQWSAIPSADD